MPIAFYGITIKSNERLKAFLLYFAIYCFSIFILLMGVAHPTKSNTILLVLQNHLSIVGWAMPTKYYGITSEPDGKSKASFFNISIHITFLYFHHGGRSPP